MTDGYEKGAELAKIRWVRDDLRTALTDKFGREPTCEEMHYYLNNVDWNALEERSIELGWEVLRDLISMAEEKYNAD